ncbi:hypothetical protein P3T23_007481 [Paraburkholderia sp. GAS448]|uniref:hypothetical protein n=1 Tax=Paraburkholderia sp. GAS448 TaxID=3035136 RepID=UPI003D232AC1
MNAFHWIAGEWTGTPAVDSIDPATGLAIGRFTTAASLKPTPPAARYAGNCNGSGANR